MLYDVGVGRRAIWAHLGLPRSDGIPLQKDSIAKRVIDVSLSACALLCLSPLLLLVACIIKLESRGPVLFRQVRNGKSGKTFEILKFRSMTFERNAVFKQCEPSDTRITAFGKFLRKSSIDELPQLINVLRGDMSLVGPRPHPVELDLQFANVLPNYMARYVVRPGMTGWAQVLGLRGPTQTSKIMAARLVADSEYIRRWSLGFDLLIIARTVPALLFPDRAY